MNTPATQHPPREPAWSHDELRHDPHANNAKADKVRRMFAAIADRYDLNNRLHSLGRDQAWRRTAVRLANLKPTDHVLDVACGTGDLTRAFADADAARVTGADFTNEMLDVARAKRLHPARRPDRPNITYDLADAMNLPYDDESFDVVSIAFGIRNVAEPPRALAEFRRVLRPGGRLVILEFDRPRFPPFALANDLYTRVIMPRTATLIARDTSGAYFYLPRSVERFLDRDQMAHAIRDAGFTDVHQKPLTLGICVCHTATTNHPLQAPPPTRQRPETTGPLHPSR